MPMPDLYGPQFDPLMGPQSPEQGADTGAWRALIALQNPEMMAEMMASQGLPPPAGPPQASSGVDADLGALLEPAAPQATGAPQDLAAMAGGGMPGMGTAMTQQQQGPLAGVTAPPSREVPMPGTPGVPHPSQAIDPGNLLQLLFGMQGAPQAVPTLQSVLGR